MSTLSYEKRPLKKPRIGPPDVYPQEPKQKEDELTSINVKHGFATMPQLTDEFGTARNCNVSASKIGAYFNAIIARKEELSTLPDSGRKRQQINPKDNFWPATIRTKNAIEAWFKDLAGNKPLMNLAKKAPNFNKKEEIFMMLCEYQVPMLRATWFIKLSSAYTVAVSEAKIKKRQLPDPTTEWTATLVKFLKDQIPKLQDYYHHSGDKSGSTPGPVNTPLQAPMHSPAHTTTTLESDHKLANRQWSYCIQLAKYMYEEGLLDRQEYLNWILELMDKMKSQPSDDGILKLFLPLALQFLDEFVQSELLSRRLGFLCAKKLSYMCNSVAETTLSLTSPQSDLTKNESQSADKDKKDLVPSNPLQITFNEYLNCPHHRDIILELSCILQVIGLECPTALVWCGVGENRTTSVWHGSPLDLLQVAPSMLPMPSRVSNTSYRKQLRQAENNIRNRSRQAEGRWCADKWQTSSAAQSALVFFSGMATSKVLAALDALDRHRFDRMDANNSLDTLYNKIFIPPGGKETAPTNNTSNSGNTVVEGKENRTEYNASQDEAIIQILCEWAVSHERCGEHRAMAVAWLLDKRQSDVTSADSENATADDKDSTSSANNQPGGLPVFQSLLMKFLDNDAPVLEDNSSPQSRAMFTNLVHLFAELIRHDVFSHDAYMCTLISRGDLLTGGNVGGQAGAPHSNKPATPANQGLDDDMFAGIDLKPTKLEVPDHSRPMDYDDSKIDDDLDKILQHIKEDQQNSLDAPDSPKDPDSHGHHSHIIPSGMNSVAMETDHVDHKIKPSRHLLYTTHFPLPQDESFSQHDCNQRYVLLYGVGKVRDEARHTVKKMSKEICKLFSKKFSIDVAEGGKVKKHSRNEFNFEATTQKCQSLSYFDQHVVTWQCSATVIEMLNSFASGNSNYLPVQEHVAFLFDLMELALNIYGLIDVCIQILKELPEVEAQLLAKGSVLMRHYTTSLSLYVVGVLRRYHCCLLLSSDQTSAVFDGLCRVVKHVSNPGDCSSAERCILAHLYDLYSSCSLLKSKPHTVEPFGNAYPKIRQALYSALQPNPSNNCVYNAQFMQEIFASPRRGGKIEPAWARQLNESPNNRYSFVINAVVTVCRETDNDRLNDLSVMCAEMTACCNALSGEWLGVLVALCCPISHPNFYMDVLAQVDIQDLTIHNSLAVFTSILIARHCFSLEDFVARIALPSLLKVKSLNEGRSETAVSAEAGMRLTCHLLLRLFKTVECPQPGLYSVSTSPHPLPASQQPYSIRHSCDRHLLAAAHNNINVGPVLAVLKAILVVGDATAKENKAIGKKSDTPTHSSGGGKGQLGVGGELSISHILGTSDMLSAGDDHMLDLTVVELDGNNARTTQRQQNNTNANEGTASLSAFAWHVLREICSQQWVLERCLSHPEELCHPDNLLDPLLTHSQAQRLLHMICYPETSSAMDELDQKSVISMILENLEQWTLRMSWLDLQLMFKQFNSNSSELNQWLDTVAKAAIDVFQLTSASGVDNKSSKIDIKGKSGSIWLVAPLVSKLPSAVQGRVLKVAGQVLESGNWSCRKSQDSREGKNKRNVDSENEGQSLLSHQPFLSLVLTCLKGQDDQRESLLSSLHSQLSQFLSMSKDERMNNYDDPKVRELLLDALQLRFSLVGGMFDTIQRNTTVTTDWAILLVQLVTYGVIDLNNNSELFTTVIDMLATLVHSTLVTDSQIEKDENKKHYQNLMKKLRKELGDRNSPSVQHVRQLLPLPKITGEIIACEPVGCLTDTKGNKIAGFDSIDKKQGLQVSDKQRVSTWDLLEGHKNPAPLSWSWFGAVKIERKPLWYEDTHRLLRYHTHNLQRLPNYYLDPMPLPPEDLEPIQEKPLKDCELKADTPSSVDQSPRSAALGKGRGKGQRRPRKPKPGSGNVTTPAAINQPGMAGMAQQNPAAMGQPQQANMAGGGIPMQGVQGPPQVPHMAYGQGNAGIPQNQGQQQFNPNQGPQQWYQQQQQQQQQQQPQQPQQGYYPQQMPNVSRFERPQINQSKQALSNMLRQRHPLNQFMGPAQAAANVQPGPQGAPGGYQPMQRQFPRQPLRQQHPAAMQGNQAMFQQSYGNMQPGMNQSYGGYGGQQMMQGGQAMMQTNQPPPMMQANQQNMMSGFGAQQQGFVNQQSQQSMMAQRSTPQADYMAAQQRAAAMGQATRPQYMQQAPNVTMNTMGPLNGGQGVPAPPYSRTAGGGKPVVQSSQQAQQFQQQQRIRQQMLAMQQQQQQQQQQQGGGQQAQQQPTPALVAHLRQMNQQTSQQHNPYQHQPPPYNM